LKFCNSSYTEANCEHNRLSVYDACAWFTTLLYLALETCTKEIQSV